MSEKFNFEGFGLVHLEANLCGSLTIGSRGSANEEIIKDGHSGLIKTDSFIQNKLLMLCQNV